MRTMTVSWFLTTKWKALPLASQLRVHLLPTPSMPILGRKGRQRPVVAQGNEDRSLAHSFHSQKVHVTRTSLAGVNMSHSTPSKFGCLTARWPYPPALASY